jgi:hypothetical protein
MLPAGCASLIQRFNSILSHNTEKNRLGNGTTTNPDDTGIDPLFLQHDGASIADNPLDDLLLIADH